MAKNLALKIKVSNIAKSLAPQIKISNMAKSLALEIKVSESKLLIISSKRKVEVRNI